MNAILAAAILAAPLSWDTLSEPMSWDVLGAAPITEPADEYTTAYAAWERGEPMVIFLTAAWCAPCQVAKQHLPALARYGRLVLIDIDAQPDLARQLMPSEQTIPRVLWFRRGEATRTYIGDNIRRLATGTGQ